MEGMAEEVFFMVLGAVLFLMAVTLLLIYRGELVRGNEYLYRLAAEEYVLTGRPEEGGKLE